MKAIRFMDPGVIEYSEIPQPEIRDDEVLAQIAYAGFCATDIELLTGEMIHIKNGNTKYPIIPGHEYVAIPQRHLYHIPEGLSLEEAALAEPAATAMYAVTKAQIPAGAQVLVIGDGPIGQLAAQLANIAGASRVIMAGSWDEKLAIARECGIHETINYHNEDVIQRARELTEGGPEIVIETSGSNVALNMAVQALKPTGRIVAVSWYNGANVDVAMNTLIVKDAALIGSLASPNSFTPVLRYMVEGKLKVKPLITHIKRLEDFQNVIEMIRAKKEMRIKVLLKP